MARNIHRLVDSQLKSATKPLNDGGNLWIYPRGGARSWIFRFMLAGRAREMGLGAYPDVSLAEARAAAESYRKVLRAGIDPIEYRDQQRKEAVLQAARSVSFTSCAARYIRAHRRGWRNRKHARQWVSTLKTYACPSLGSLPVADIGTEHVLNVLKPLWGSKTETAKRVRGRIENILDWATAHEYRTGQNPARWRGHLDKILPPPARLARVTHHPAMPYAEVPAFLNRLHERPGTPARALEFLILTACRTGEVINAKRGEFDLDAGVWSIPADRMKAKRPHRVPLTAEAIALLESLPVLTEFVFPGARYGRPISNMSMLTVMRDMGDGQYVPHGFRSSFRDWAAERTSFPREVAEAALAHVVKDKVEAAYQRGDMFEKRRKLMQAWAGAIFQRQSQGKIVPIQRPA